MKCWVEEPRIFKSDVGCNIAKSEYSKGGWFTAKGGFCLSEYLTETDVKAYLDHNIQIEP